MWQLLRAFPLLVGHFLKERDANRVQQLLGILMKICSIVFSPKVTEFDIRELDASCKSFLCEFKGMFGDKITSKLVHRLQHYPRNLELKGPLLLYSGWRFGGKRTLIKHRIATSLGSHNMPKSVATQQAWLQAYNIKYKCFTTPPPALTSIELVEVDSMPLAEAAKD
jgi:hypothetical protein